MDSPWLTKAEAAAYLRVHPNTMTRLLRTIPTGDRPVTA